MEYYDEFVNNYYTPIEDAGENANWKAIEKGFNKIENNLAKPFVVTFMNDAPTESDPFGGHVDKTEEEISIALDEGKKIIGHVISEQFNLDFFTPMQSYAIIDGKIEISITNIGYVAGNLIFVRLFNMPSSLEYGSTIYKLDFIEN